MDSVSELTTTTLDRLKYFSYYLTENLETNLELCLKLLEERDIAKKSNSAPVSAASALSTQIPIIGKGISSAIKQGEIFILDRIDKENAKTLSDLVYFFSDHRAKVRTTLIYSCIDIFSAYEQQFTQITCGSGVKKAMQKMALDGSARILSFFLNKKCCEISRDNVSRGVVFGTSLRNKLRQACGRTVTLQGVKHTTSEVYTKVGLYDGQTGEYFANKQQTNSNIFGYRRLFRWECADELRGLWDICDNDAATYSYDSQLGQHFGEIAEYIINQKEEEAARHDRERKHRAAEMDREEKHEETIKCFNERLDQVAEMLANQFIELTNEQNETRQEIIAAIKNAHSDAVGTKKESEEMAREICIIRDKVERVEDNQREYEHTTKVIKNVDGVLRQVQAEYKRTETVAKDVVQKIDKVAKNTEKDIRKIFGRKKKK